MIVLQIIIGVIAAVGVGFLLADFMKIPSLKASKAANSVGRKGKKKTGVICSTSKETRYIVFMRHSKHYISGFLCFVLSSIGHVSHFL